MILDSLQLLNRSFTPYVPGVEGGCWLEEEDLYLLLRHRQMLHPCRHHDHFPLLKRYIVIAEPHTQPPAQDQEKLVLVRMAVPDEFPFQPGKLDLLAVQIGDDLRAPMLAESFEFLAEIDLIGHVLLLFR